MKQKYNFTCTGAPVQAEGKIMRHDWYFRSRHSGWSFDVAKVMWKTEILFQCNGGYDDNEHSGFGASWMSLRKAEKIIDACLALYRTVPAHKIGHVIQRNKKKAQGGEGL